MALVVREFQPSDINDLIEVFRLSVRIGAASDYTEEQRTAWAPDRIDPEEWLIKRAGRLTWVAVLDGRLTGFTDLESDGHIDMLYVHPDFHRRGIATALLHKVVKTAEERHVAQLFTEASLTARPFFEVSGFTVIEEQSVRRNGQNFIRFLMRKML